MFIERIEIPRYKKDGTLSKQIRVLIRFKCDHCNKIYDKQPCSVSRTKHNIHFCGNTCKFASSRKGGTISAVIEKTNLERHGTAHVFQNETVKAKIRKTFQQRYGACSPLAVPEFMAKRRRTQLERYGAEETFQVELFKRKREATWQKRYGVPYVPIDQNKVRQAMERMPTKWSSKIENRMHEMLCQCFKEVKRQKWVNKWPIDFYVADIDTYIQVDGIYWHALDCDVATLKESRRPRDQARFAKWKTDRQQNEWFAKHSLNLIRVTDMQIKQEGAQILLRLPRSLVKELVPIEAHRV